MNTQITLSAPYPNIYNLHIVGICLTFITACSVFKEKSFFQTDTLRKQQTERQVQSSQTVQTSAVRIYSLEDSSDKRSFTEIFPEGIFSYSAEKGYSGNAKRIVIKERVKGGKISQESTKIKEHTSTISDLRESQRLLAQTGEKEKVVIGNNFNLWYLLGLLLIFTAVYLFRRRLQE